VKKINSLLILSLLLSNIVSAQTYYNAPDSGDVLIEKQVGMGGEHVGVTVRKGEKTVYLGQTLSDADGNIQLKLDFSGEEDGTYQLITNVNGKMEEDTISYEWDGGVEISPAEPKRIGKLRVGELVPTQDGAKIMAENTTKTRQKITVYKATYEKNRMIHTESAEIIVPENSKTTNYPAEFFRKTKNGQRVGYFVWDTTLTPYAMQRDARLACVDFRSVVVKLEQGAKEELLIDIDDACIHHFTGSENTVAEVDYLDSGFGAFVLKYDGFTHRENESEVIEMTNTGEWKTKRIYIPDGYFNNYYQGADLCLSVVSDRIGKTSDDNQKTDVTIGGVRVYTLGTKALVDVTTQSTEKGNLFLAPDVPELTVRIANSDPGFIEKIGNREYGVEIAYDLYDENENLIRTWYDAGWIHPAYGEEKTVKIPVEKYGIYHLRTRVSNAELQIYRELMTEFSYGINARAYKNDKLGTSGGNVDRMADAGFGWLDHSIQIDYVADHQTKEMKLKDAYREGQIEAVAEGLQVMTEIGASGHGIFEFAPDEHSPRSAEGLQVYGDYCEYMAKELGKLGSLTGNVFETWNEFDGATNVDNRPYSDYANFLKYAWQRIKSEDVNPNATIVGPSSACEGYDIMLAILLAGGGNYMDVCSIHPYDWTQDPVSADIIGEITKTRNLLNRFGYKNMPIWLTEIGWADDCYGVTTREQGYYLVQLYTMLQKNSLADKMFIYCFGDRKDVRGARESSFGLLNADATPKPSYLMIAAMNRFLSGAKFVSSKVIATDVHTYTFSDQDENPVTVCWSVKGDGNVTVQSDSEILVYDSYGNLNTQKTETLSLNLTKEPVYIYGDITIL